MGNRRNGGGGEKRKEELKREVRVKRYRVTGKNRKGEKRGGGVDPRSRPVVVNRVCILKL